ncbi:MAG TPA: hypothetical protein VKT49_06550 [Bryobacteraceae bacterium]|nr:hypothetical protein [Bryobacteraceae bacterium]
MKPFQIALLVVAGAVGGAVVMKVASRPQPAAPPAPVVAQETPLPAPAPAAEPAPPPEPVKPEPFVEKAKPRPKPKPVKRDPDPVAVASSAPAPSAPAPVAAAAPPPAPEVPPPAPREPERAAAPPPPPPPQQVTLNAGMLIPVRLIDGLSTERNHPGDNFTGTLDQPLVVDGLVIAERGARVEGRVANTDQGGKVSGVASITVQLTRIKLSDGQTIAVQTDNFERKADTTHKTDAAKVGAGAAIGAIIGAIAGGGKGAAIGAGVGGGAGAGDVLLTRGKAATIPSETKISFKLSAPVTVTERQQ